MSPQLYRKIRGKTKNSTFDPKSNDYHQLGMTLLNLGTQDSVQDCYLPNGEIN